jgi:hypothetical protein
MSSQADIKRVKPYKFKQNLAEAEWLSLASILFGVYGMTFRVRWASWAALFATMSGFMVQRKDSLDWKQVIFSCMFAIMGLATSYLTPQMVDA